MPRQLLRAPVNVLATFGMSLLLALTTLVPLRAQSPAGTAALPGQAILLELEGQVEVSRAGSPLWDPARALQPLLPGDRIRTGDRSRAVLQLSDKTVLRKGPQTIVEIPEASRSGIRLLKGILFYFHRDKPRDFPVVMPACYAAIAGTEFSVSVSENGSTTLHLIDGNVELTNSFGQLTLRSGESGAVEFGAAPARTRAVTAVRAVQWCLYYPAILRVEELNWPAAPPVELSASLQAYRQGDVLRALSAYPSERQPATDTERIYFAALLLAAGDVERAEAELSNLSEARGVPGRARTKAGALAVALRRVVATVRTEREPARAAADAGEEASSSPGSGSSATELLAESYVRQSMLQLDAALAAARAAVAVAPDFGFGWVRVAELEFSFGRIDAARAALERGLGLTPQQAEAHSLMGFLRAAENRPKEALKAFDEAIALDGALGNAWLGRGLCRIRMGDLAMGRRDLLVAVTVEPQRAVLRSYLAKAFTDSYDPTRAAHELTLAKQLDSGDPTAWLYSALLNQQRNRINDAIDELERARQLNDNRAVYRSRLLLDQDRAVSGANLANVHADAGLTDVSVREASRAVNADYANPSAHLFLANSYDALRDPRQVNQRYETPWASEFLVANLLAPVGAGPLSPYVTRQEYSKLFERDRLGLASSTEYLSRGDWLQTASQFGTLRNSSYALDVSYRSENGERPNNDFQQLTTGLTLKQQLSPKDSVLLQAGYYDANGGDVNQYYDPRVANRGLRVEETQEPYALAGYHRAWLPGVHSLFLAGRIPDRLEVANPQQETLLFQRDAAGAMTAALPFSIEQHYRSTLELYTVELQQVVQHEGMSWLAGGRFQSGEFDTRNVHTNADVAVAELDDFTEGILEDSIDASQATNRRNFNPAMHRWAAYSYLYVRPVEPLLLVGGLTYDDLTWPQNHRYAPLSDDEDGTRRLSPKAGLIWTPTRHTAVRGVYARSLGGVSLDQSYQLEPTQVAGFVQTYRSLIPESVEGANAAATFETWGLSWEESIAGRTYVGLTGEVLGSAVQRTIGAYNQDENFITTVSQTAKELDYEERNLGLTFNQLMGAEWSVGARYRLSQARLEGRFEEIGASVTLLGGLPRRTEEEATLHQTTLFVLFNHASGFYSQGQARWNRQETDGMPSNVHDEDVWQFDVWAGWRFFGRRLELTAGVLNLTDRDYRLHPLNLTAQLPRERTYFTRLRFHF